MHSFDPDAGRRIRVSVAMDLEFHDRRSKDLKSMDQVDRPQEVRNEFFR